MRWRSHQEFYQIDVPVRMAKANARTLPQFVIFFKLHGYERMFEAYHGLTPIEPMWGIVRRERGFDAIVYSSSKAKIRSHPRRSGSGDSSGPPTTPPSGGHSRECRADQWLGPKGPKSGTELSAGRDVVRSLQSTNVLKKSSYV